MNILDLKPGRGSVNIKVTVSEISEPKQVITSKDETGDDVGFGDAKVLSRKGGDVLQIGNGFVTSFKGEWRINGARAIR